MLILARIVFLGSVLYTSRQLNAALDEVSAQRAEIAELKMALETNAQRAEARFIAASVELNRCRKFLDALRAEAAHKDETIAELLARASAPLLQVMLKKNNRWGEIWKFTIMFGKFNERRRFCPPIFLTVIY